MTTFAEKYIKRMEKRLNTVRADIKIQRELYNSAFEMIREPELFDIPASSAQWRLVAQRAESLAQLVDYENMTLTNLEDARNDIESSGE